MVCDSGTLNRVLLEISDDSAMCLSIAELLVNFSDLSFCGANILHFVLDLCRDHFRVGSSE